MEMVLRGQLFVDRNGREMGEEVVRRTVGMMEAYENGSVFQENEDDNKSNDNDNSNSNEEQQPASDYHQYCQMLFNTRIKQFIEIELTINNDPFGFNQTWLNKPELTRLSPDLFDTVSQLLIAKSIHQPPFKNCPPVIEIVIEGQQLRRFKEMTEDGKMQIGEEEYMVESGGQTFGFNIAMQRASSLSPLKCELFLYLRRKSCSASLILFDIVCPEMRFERVNIRKRFKQIGEYDSRTVFSNQTENFKNVQELTIKVCIRVVAWR